MTNINHQCSEGTVKASDFALMLLDLASTIHTEISKVHLHYEDNHLVAACDDMRITLTNTREGGAE